MMIVAIGNRKNRLPRMSIHARVRGDSRAT